MAVPAPDRGPGNWAGAPSAAFEPGGTLLIAYRVRTPDRRGGSVVVARWQDGGHLTPLASLERDLFGAESLERPALVSVGGGWRLYVSCATPGSKHWRIDALDAEDPARFAEIVPRTVFPGSARLGVKDPVIRRRADGWHAWICCHPLDEPDEEDRMTTAYATSGDGLSWTWHGTVLSGLPGGWDARGARVTSVLDDGRASYDGRATKEENFSERTGIALPSADGAGPLRPGAAPVADVRYLDVVPSPEGGCLLLFERPRPDGSHDLCLQRWALTGRKA